MNYILRILISIDMFLNVVVCNGSPVETMSSTAYRMHRDGRFWGFMCPVIDMLFLFTGPKHCYRSYVECKHNWYAAQEFHLEPPDAD